MITRKKFLINFVFRKFKLNFFYTSLVKLTVALLNFYFRKTNDVVLEVWARNSLVLNYFEPGVSDLDLTIFLARPLTELELNRLRKQLQWLKKIYPLTGEYSLIQASGPDLNVILRNQNIYEQSRDPKLQSRQADIKTFANKTDQLIFFHKMLLSNLDDIEKYPELRLKKWRHHFDLLNIKSDARLSALNLSKAIWSEYALLVNSVFTENISVDEIKSWLEKLVKTDSQPLHIRFDKGTLPTWFYILNFNLLCFFKKELTNLSRAENEALLKIVKWEVIGLKYNFSVTPVDHHQHIQHLIAALGCIADLDQDAYKDLMKFLEPANQAV